MSSQEDWKNEPQTAPPRRTIPEVEGDAHHKAATAFIVALQSLRSIPLDDLTLDFLKARDAIIDYCDLVAKRSDDDTHGKD